MRSIAGRQGDADAILYMLNQGHRLARGKLDEHVGLPSFGRNIPSHPDEQHPGTGTNTDDARFYLGQIPCSFMLRHRDLHLNGQCRIPGEG